MLIFQQLASRSFEQQAQHQAQMLVAAWSQENTHQILINTLRS